ncbi:TetR/AcrR family transcriptional regulator [Pseudomonas alcaligenes]|uniref:TetR/AcrR family transcriptional regulator n=1 Tax=Pseudomonas sp. RIT-PI-AD TaxID=3035294 RepID=UPI0021D9F87E
MAAPGQREKTKSQRRLKILEVASRQFKEQGFEKTRIEEIARQADVAAGTVYNYFPTKDILLMELVAYHREHSPKALASLLSAPPLEPVQAFLQFYEVMAEESLRYLDKLLWRHALAAFAAGSWNEAIEKRWQHERELVTYQVAIAKSLQHEGVLARELDVAALVEVIHACGFCCWQQFLVRDDFDFPMFLSTLRGHLAFIFARLAPSGAHAPSAGQ